MQVQPPGAEFPDARVPIRTLEIRAPCFLLRINIPAPTSFVRDQWPAVCCCHFLREDRIFLDRVESIEDGECGSFELPESLGEIVICLL